VAALELEVTEGVPPVNRTRKWPRTLESQKDAMVPIRGRARPLCPSLSDGGPSESCRWVGKKKVKRRHTRREKAIALFTFLKEQRLRIATISKLGPVAFRKRCKEKRRKGRGKGRDHAPCGRWKKAPRTPWKKYFRRRKGSSKESSKD